MEPTLDRKLKRRRMGSPEGRDDKIRGGRPGKIIRKPTETLGMQARRRERQARKMRQQGSRMRQEDRVAGAGGYMTGGQAKIAAKAPPRNKIDGKDFAVLRKEKAKGRGMGLQDEKMKPGKIMKADKGGMGEAKGYKKYLQGLKKAEGEQFRSKFKARRMALAGGKAAMKAARASTVGKIAAGVAGAALLAKAGLEKMYEKRTGKKPFTKRPAKKMGGGMMQRPMGYESGSKKAIAVKIAQRLKSKDRVTSRDYKKAKGEATKAMGGYMGGGMMQRPIMASKGKSVKVKCKLGRNKPTKMY